jgi:hypothetical protein
MEFKFYRKATVRTLKTTAPLHMLSSHFVLGDSLFRPDLVQRKRAKRTHPGEAGAPLQRRRFHHEPCAAAAN